MKTTALEFALSHKWEGRRLGEYTLRELDEIFDCLDSVALPHLRVPRPNSEDALIIAIWRLDKALEPHRPLSDPRIKPGPDRGYNGHSHPIPQRRY